MATLEFYDKHNMVAYLEKPEGNAEFHQIIDFLTTTTASTNVNGEVELTASIDGQAKTITEASLRRHLKLEDNGGITSLPNTEIFEQLALMGVSLNELMDLVTQLTNKVGSLENELTNTKKVYGSAITKLVKRVKKLEKQVKTGKARRRTKIVLSEDEAEKISDDTKVLLEEEKTTKLIEELTGLWKIKEVVKKGNKRSAEKRKDKGKAIMIEDESVQKKSKKQLEQERLSHEEAIRLQEQIDEEERKRIARDAEIAKHCKKNMIKLERKKLPRSVAEVRKNMLMYLKNQGGYKMKDFKGMSYDDIRPIFEKVWDQVHSFVPMDSKEEVQRLKRAGQDVEAKPAKRQRTEEVSELVQEQTNEEPKTDA
ncbi:hypothetical protein Tco_0025248 [Tanacetum coccineum]